MKFWTAPPIVFTTVLFTTPAWAQTTDQNINEGAGVIAWILVGLIGGYLASRIVNKAGGTRPAVGLQIIGDLFGETRRRHRGRREGHARRPARSF
jgi:hypothetical protein